MCSHRLAIAKLVRDYKEPLFSPVSSQLTRQNKQELWEFIRQQAVAQGAIQYARKSWKEIRDCVWAPIRRDTMAKLNKAKTVGEDTVLFTEIDKIVLEIIGSNGTGGATNEDSKYGEQLLLQTSGMNGHLLGQQQSNNDNDSLSCFFNNSFADLNFSTTSAVDLMANGPAAALANEFSLMEAKPDATLSQMLEILRGETNNQQQHHNNSMLVGGSPLAVHSAPMGSCENGPQSAAGGIDCVALPPHLQHGQRNRRTPTPNAQNPLKRRAPVADDPHNPAGLHHRTSRTCNGYDSEMEKKIKQAQLEQIQLQNSLIKEEIEEKRLQNRLLRMDLEKRENEREREQEGNTTGN